MFDAAVTNAANWTNAGFAASGTWSYTTPASQYFWAGFAVFFIFGLVSLLASWLKRVAGGGFGE